MNIEEKQVAIANGVIAEAREKCTDSGAERAGYCVASLARACALLTSPVKAEREAGKQMVRDWRISHAKADSVE
jgi:hypothetical protein